MEFTVIGYGTSNINLSGSYLEPSSSDFFGTSVPENNATLTVTNDVGPTPTPTVPVTLTVSSNHGIPTPSGTQTYNSGTSVTASVTSPVIENGVTYNCTGWRGTGSVPATGTGATASFTITADSTITWAWQAISGSNSLPTGIVSLVQSGTDISSWSYGPSPDPIGTTFSVDVRIDGASGIWAWVVDDLDWNPGVVQLTSIQEGSYLNDYSTNWISPPAIDNVNGQIIGDFGCGILTDNMCTEAASSGVLAILTFQIVGYGNASLHVANVALMNYFTESSANLKGGAYVVTNDAAVTVDSSVPMFTLTSTTPFSNFTPIGIPSYASGSSVTAAVTSPFTDSYGDTYICTGWIGTGDVPATGTGSSVTFTITQDSSITWIWQSSPGNFVLPEYVCGALISLISALAAFIAFAILKKSIASPILSRALKEANLLLKRVDWGFEPSPERRCHMQYPLFSSFWLYRKTKLDFFKIIVWVASK
jgi:hypothetical protein